MGDDRCLYHQAWKGSWNEPLCLEGTVIFQPQSMSWHPDRVGVFVVGGPAPCLLDFNADGFINPDDLSDFITCFFLQIQFPGVCPQADFNADGFLNPDDLSDFITSFFLGC